MDVNHQPAMGNWIGSGSGNWWSVCGQDDVAVDILGQYPFLRYCCYWDSLLFASAEKRRVCLGKTKDI